MRRRMRFRALLVALALALASVAAGCGDDDEGNGGGAGGGGTDTAADVSGDVSVVGIWTGPEQRSFQAVIDRFNETYPDVRVNYQAAGDNVPTVVGTAVEGGNPPDIATIAQPGLIEQFQARGALEPIDYARDTIEDNYSSDFVDLGTIDGELYTFVFKGANKSTVWFNVRSFENAGVEPPATWEEMQGAARTIEASGVPTYSIAGADGWTLTDLFENIYIRQAGPEMYDQLAEHRIPWTDESVRTALASMGEIFQNGNNIAGGRSGALQTEFPDAVTNVFSEDPRAALIIEGDFVPGVIGDANPLEPETGYDVFAFPSIDDSAEMVVGGGDSITVFSSTPAVRAFVEWLATPEAAEVWAERGGFSSPNRNLDPSVYPDEITRETASAIAEAETFRFDMSDLAPAAFGGTPGQGEWAILQDFLANPRNVDGTAQALERSAARAFRDQR